LRNLEREGLLLLAVSPSLELREAPELLVLVVFRDLGSVQFIDIDDEAKEDVVSQPMLELEGETNSEPALPSLRAVRIASKLERSKVGIG
jgi:hypothetical protein